LVKGKIITTLVKLKSSGKADNTLKSYWYRLETLAKHVNLDGPNEVSRFISNIKGSGAYKVSFVKAYNHYVRFNGLSWIKPKYKAERKLPKIPTTETIKEIIARASCKYAVIFKLLAETGVMPCELHNMTLRDIDLDRGTIAVQGFKGHASRMFKLKPETQAMLKMYLVKYGNEKPLFPNSKSMFKAWTRLRNILAEKLQQAELRTIRLYDLRHYFATMTYYKTKDILFTKQQMGHKKIETTLIYTQLVNFGEEEWTSAVVRNLPEACKLIDAGFEYVTEMEDAKIFRKRK
jgi:integrase